MVELVIKFLSFCLNSFFNPIHACNGAYHDIMCISTLTKKSFLNPYIRDFAVLATIPASLPRQIQSGLPS